MTHLNDSLIYSTGEGGVMRLAGHDVRDLVSQFGSPLVVMLEEPIRTRCRDYKKRLECYPRSRVYFASKAFLTTGFCKLMEQEGMGLDVVSWGELRTALAAGFPPDQILMHGNAKTERDLTEALEAGVGRIVIDNLDEIARLEALATKLDKEPAVMIRVTPGVKPSTHKYVQTGQQDSKFGFNLVGGAADEAARQVLAHKRLRLVGLHCHIGSQLFNLKPYVTTAGLMMELYARLKNELGAPLDELNMGGGLGIRYQPDEDPPSVQEHLENLSAAVLEAAARFGVEPPLLIDEPGRSIVGRAGVTLYTIQSTKRIPGIRNYASVDGGMTDNPRYALYNARHQILAATKMEQQAETLWAISGRCCESGDMLIHDVCLPELSQGDVLAVLSTGAYTYSMASNYNRVARPAVVLAGQGRVGLLAAREEAEELLRLDRVPEWLL